jgi:hypothetical protein
MIHLLILIRLVAYFARGIPPWLHPIRRREARPWKAKGVYIESGRKPIREGPLIFETSADAPVSRVCSRVAEVYLYTGTRWRERKRAYRRPSATGCLRLFKSAGRVSVILCIQGFIKDSLINKTELRSIGLIGIGCYRYLYRGRVRLLYRRNGLWSHYGKGYVR